MRMYNSLKIALTALWVCCGIITFFTGGYAAASSAPVSCAGGYALPPINVNPKTLSVTVSPTTSFFEIQADGDYVITNGLKDRSKASYFGQWKNTGMIVTEGTSITVNVSGAVTLCTQVLPTITPQIVPNTLNVCLWPCTSGQLEGNLGNYIASIGTAQTNGFLGFYSPNASSQVTSGPLNFSGGQISSCQTLLNFYLQNGNVAQTGMPLLLSELTTGAWTALPVQMYQATGSDSAGYFSMDPSSNYNNSNLTSLLPTTLGVVPIGIGPSFTINDTFTGTCTVEAAQSGCVTSFNNIDPNTKAGALLMYIGADPNGADGAANTVTITTATYQGTSPQQGTIWFKIVDANNNWQDNTNHYNVSVTTSSIVDNGSVIDNFITPIKTTLGTVAEQMFSQSVANSTFQNIIRTLVVLYVVISFMLFTLGMIEEPVRNFVVRVIKIAIVMSLITNPNSYTFFYNNALGAFINGRDMMIAVVTGGSTTDKDLFGFIDQIWNTYFNPTTGQYIKAFYFSVGDSTFSSLWKPYLGVISTIWVYALCYALYSYAYCIGVALMSYMLSYTATALMTIIAPIFISFLLFETTKKYFQEYFKYFFMFALQPVILFMMLTILNSIVLLMFAQAMGGLTACPVCADAWEPLFAMLGLPGLAIYAILQSVLCVNTYAITYSSADIIPITMNLIGFLMMTHLMRHVVDFAASFTGFLTGTQEASGGLKLAVDPKKFLDDRAASKEQGQATKIADKIKKTGK